jgi:hypothetical protein
MSPEQVGTALDGLRSSFDRIEAFTRDCSSTTG